MKKSNIISLIAFLFSIWMISGQSLNVILQWEFIERIEIANVIYHEDVYINCAERYYGEEYGVETFNDCLLHRALNIVDHESYIVPIFMALGYDRDMSEIITTALFQEFANQDAYYGEG